THPVPLADDTLAAPRELVDDETGERVASPAAATAEMPDPTVAMPVIARSEQLLGADSAHEPSSERTATEKRPRRRVSLIVLGVLGALAIVAGILIVALRDEDSTPETPTTTIPAPTTIVVTTTISPVTTAPPSTTLPTTTAAG